MRKITLSLAGVLFLSLGYVSHAQEYRRYTFCGDRYCPTYIAPVKHNRQARGSRHCPRYLGCGCNLAEYFHIAGKRWRELWVARNWAREGHRAERGCVGCVVVLSRGKRGGHVGVVKRYDANGNPVVYSYANGRLGWTTATYSRRRVLAYRNLL